MKNSAAPLSALFVEDSASDAALVVRQLEKGGFQVRHERVDSAPAMHAALQKQSWDVVLSDFNVPGFGAGAALDLLRQSGHDVPFIVISGVIEEAAAIELMRKGAHDYLMKSDLGRLVSVVQRELTEACERLAHRQDQEALRASERRHRLLADNASDVIWTMGLDGRFTYVSPAVTKLFGYSVAEALQRTVQDTFTPQSVVTAKEGLAQALQAIKAGQPFPGFRSELEHVCKDGSTLWAEVTSTEMHDASGQVNGILGVTRDITERRAADKKIRKLSQMYAALSQCNEAIIRCATEDQLFHAVCKAIVGAGGLKFAWIGMVEPDSQRVVPVAHFGAGAEYLQGIEISVAGDDPLGRGHTGTAIREDRPYWCPDFSQDPQTAPWHERGKPYGWRASAALPLHRDGVPVGALTLYLEEANAFDDDICGLLLEMAADISYALDNLARHSQLASHAQELERGRAAMLSVLEDQRAAQAALRDSELRFRLLIEKSLAGMFVSRDGQYVYANPRLEKILGYGPGQLNGVRAVDVVLPEDLPILLAARQQLKVGENSVSYEARARRLDGSVVELGIQGVTVDYEGARATIGMVQDIGENNRAQAEIKGYIAQLEHTTEGTLQAVALMVELRDPYTAGHQRRVGELAAAIGTEMGLPEDTVKGLRLTGYVHDIGKISVPAELLSKPSRLSAIEFELIKTHAQAGADILKNVDFPWPVAEVILQHHERPDGSGYPRRLKGGEIILEARVMAVADVVEAMASHRPYRPGLGIDKALAEIERGRGPTYDPAVTDACLRLFHNKGFAFT